MTIRDPEGSVEFQAEAGDAVRVTFFNTHSKAEDSVEGVIERIGSENFLELSNGITIGGTGERDRVIIEGRSRGRFRGIERLFANNDEGDEDVDVATEEFEGREWPVEIAGWEFEPVSGQAVYHEDFEGRHRGVAVFFSRAPEAAGGDRWRVQTVTVLPREQVTLGNGRWRTRTRNNLRLQLDADFEDAVDRARAHIEGVVEQTERERFEAMEAFGPQEVETIDDLITFVRQQNESIPPPAGSNQFRRVDRALVDVAKQLQEVPPSLFDDRIDELVDELESLLRSAVRWLSRNVSSPGTARERRVRFEDVIEAVTSNRDATQEAAEAYIEEFGRDEDLQF